MSDQEFSDLFQIVQEIHDAEEAKQWARVQKLLDAGIEPEQLDAVYEFTYAHVEEAVSKVEHAYQRVLRKAFPKDFPPAPIMSEEDTHD